MTGSDGLDGLFEVRIGDRDLGVFTSCAGLEAGTVVVVLSRPQAGRAAAMLDWLRSRPEKSIGEITMLGPERAPLASWSLAGVMPVQWNGRGPGAPFETLELSCADLTRIIW
ncbi:hypothetical protein [Saccharopolyspora elongata]|uniref:Uncharacterized protein n=1 Tax=Saccharopolyspora elongata TaxID=2530387 RepID=A0A4R4YWQ1_9PSEU|nr:hypothetical protein [Saccharopolyspora elongata]TDD48809.1 hypothetical protein E1288_21340 [Saccharopolyspora elongata]